MFCIEQLLNNAIVAKFENFESLAFIHIRRIHINMREDKIEHKTYLNIDVETFFFFAMRGDVTLGVFKGFFCC